MLGGLENKRALFRDLHDTHCRANTATGLASCLVRWPSPSDLVIHFGELSDVVLALPSAVVISQEDANAHGPRHDR